MLTWLKAQFTRARYLTSSVRLLPGYGTLQTQAQPFRYDSAVSQFQGWVYAAAQLNAKAAAAVPLKLYVRGKPARKLYRTRPVTRKARAYLDGRLRDKPAPCVLRKAADLGTDFVEVTEQHPVLDLLSAVNPWMNGFDLTVLRFLYLELTGNAYVHPVIDKKTGVPSELWIMPSQWVDVIPGKKGSDEFITGYAYGITANEKQSFSPDEVGHFRYPNPASLYYGLGKVEAGWAAVQLDKAAHTMDTALYSNGARPDYAVIIKSGAGQTEIDRFETKLRQQLRDARDAGKFVTITGDVQIMPLAWPPKDLGERARSVEEVCAVFGVPRDKLLGNATYANAERADVGWLRDTILPMLTLDEEKLNEWYMPLWAPWIDPADMLMAYDNPVPEDKKFELEERKAALAGRAWQTVNEVRADDGLEPIEGGDELNTPAVNPFAGLFGRGGNGNGGGDDSPSGLGKRSPGPNRQSRMYAEHVHQCSETAHVRFAPSRSTSQPVACSLPPACARTIGLPWPIKADRVGSEVPGKLAREFRVALEDVLRRQSDAALAALRTSHKAIEPDQITTIMENVYTAVFAYRTELADVLTDHMLLAIQTAGDDALRQLEVVSGFNVDAPTVRAWLDHYTPRLARTITAERARQIQDVIRDAIGSRPTGETPGIVEVQHLIEDSPAFSADGIANRAELISRSESTRAYMRGQVSAWEQSGVVQGKRWELSADPCEFCEALAAEFAGRQVALHDSFYRQGQTLAGAAGGTMLLDYMDVTEPPLHPQCRCTVSAIMEGNE